MGATAQWLSDGMKGLGTRIASRRDEPLSPAARSEGAAVPLGRGPLLVWLAQAAFFAGLSATATFAGLRLVGPAWFAAMAAAALEGSIVLFSLRLATVISPAEWRRCFLAWLLCCLASAYFSYSAADSAYERNWAAQTMPVLERAALRSEAARLQHDLLPLQTTVLSRLTAKEAAVDGAIAALDFRQRVGGAPRAETRRWLAGERDQLTGERDRLEAIRQVWRAFALHPEAIISAPTPAAGRAALEQQYDTFMRQWAELPAWIRPSLPPLPAPPRLTDRGLARITTRQDDPLLGPLQRLAHPTGLERLWFALALALEFLPFGLLWTGALDPEHHRQVRLRRAPRKAALPGVDPEIEEYHQRCRQVTQVDQTLVGWARAARNQQVADAELLAGLHAGSENVGLRQLAAVTRERIALVREHLCEVGVPEAEWRPYLERLRQPFLASMETVTQHLEGDALRARWQFAACLAADLAAMRPELEPLGGEFVRECREQVTELLR